MTNEQIQRFDEKFDLNWDTTYDQREWVKTFITQLLQEERERLYAAIGMMDGVYFKKPEEGFDGSIQYIPKHLAMSIIYPPRAVDADGNHIEALPQKEVGN